MAECIFINLKESLQQFRVLGLLVSHQEGDESFTVGPPQLHVPLQLSKHTQTKLFTGSWILSSSKELFFSSQTRSACVCQNIWSNWWWKPLQWMVRSPVWGSVYPHPRSRRGHRVLCPSHLEREALNTCWWLSSGVPGRSALHWTAAGTNLLPERGLVHHTRKWEGQRPKESLYFGSSYR